MKTLTIKLFLIANLVGVATEGMAQVTGTFSSGDQFQVDPYGEGLSISVDPLNYTFTANNVQSGNVMLVYSFAATVPTGDNLLISYELFNMSDTTFSGTIGSYVLDTITADPMSLTSDIAPWAGIKVTIPVVAGEVQAMQTEWSMGIDFWGDDMPAASTLQLGDIQLQDLSSTPEPSTWAMLSMGLAFLGYSVRRRNQFRRQGLL